MGTEEVINKFVKESKMRPVEKRLIIYIALFGALIYFLVMPILKDTQKTTHEANNNQFILHREDRASFEKAQDRRDSIINKRLSRLDSTVNIVCIKMNTLVKFQPKQTQILIGAINEALTHKSLNYVDTAKKKEAMASK
jgi:hypothetical protein